MAQDKMMTQTLTSLLEAGETIQHPIYGSLMQGKHFWYGYFCLTDTHLLIALLDGNTNKIHWTTRVPLDVEDLRIQRNGLLSQNKIHILFKDGRTCSIRASQKVMGIKGQDVNLAAFIDTLQKKIDIG